MTKTEAINRVKTYIEQLENTDNDSETLKNVEAFKLLLSFVDKGVKPGTTGKWVLYYKQRDLDHVYHSYFKCSVCGGISPRDEIPDICPHCESPMEME